MTSIIGYGTAVFSAFSNYFWVPLLSPILGMAYGYWLYEKTLGDVFLNMEKE